MTEPSTPETIDAVDEGDGTPESRRAKRAADGGARPGLSGRRRLIVLGSAVAVLVIVALALLLTQRNGQMEPLTVETTTIVVPPPTPVEDPIARDTSTPLLAALPDTVLGYAVSEQTESAAMLDLAAIEGWQLTYTSVSSAVVLEVGQWPTASEATEAAADLVGEASATDQGEVLVGGTAVGSFTTFEVDDGERTVWTNRTVVFVAQGSLASTRPFYDAFPF